MEYRQPLEGRGCLLNPVLERVHKIAGGPASKSMRENTEMIMMMHVVYKVMGT